MKKNKKGIIIGVIVAVIILAGIGGASGNKDSAKIDNSNAENTTSVKSGGSTTTKENVRVGGSYEDDGLKFTVTEATFDYKFEDEYGLYKLDDGYVYLEVGFTFEVTGKKDKYVSIYDFDCYADDTQCKQQYVTSVTGDFINTNLSSGRNVSFKTLYAVPENAKSIQLEYSENMFTSDKILIDIK